MSHTVGVLEGGRERTGRERHSRCRLVSVASRPLGRVTAGLELAKTLARAAERSGGDPERVSKVAMRIPTLRLIGEGCCREAIGMCTRLIRRGNGHGTSETLFG